MQKVYASVLCVMVLYMDVCMVLSMHVITYLVIHALGDVIFEGMYEVIHMCIHSNICVFILE